MARQKLDADDLVAPHVFDIGISWTTSMRGLVALGPKVIVTVDRPADVAMQRAVIRLALDEEDGDDPVCRIDPEECRPGPVPEEFADGAAVLPCFERLAG